VQDISHETFLAFTLSSGYLENRGDGRFYWHVFPSLGQISSLNSTLLIDLNNDDYLDIIGIGNSNEFQVDIGAQDASYGTVALGYGDGLFNFLSPYQSGFYIPGDGRQIVPMNLAGKPAIVVAINNDLASVWSYRLDNLPSAATRAEK